MSKDDFFIGWSPDVPRPDRRFFLGAGLTLMAGTAASAGFLAQKQAAPGPGIWTQSEVRTFTGIATAEPYAMLRTADIDGAPKTALLSCLGKCGVTARIGSYAGQAVSVKGSLIQRGQHAMIAVVDDMDWIGPATATLPSGLSFPPIEALGEIALQGEILDSKCWFGAMRPASGKVHKTCASLCIRSGLPPAFFAKDRQGAHRLMIMTDRGTAHGTDLLPFVADPVEITAELRRWGDLLLLDSPTHTLRRL